MRLKSLFALFFALSFGLLLSSCTPGVYVGASTGYGSPYGYGGYGYGYGPSYYGRPGYYAPPVRRRAPAYGPGYRSRGGYRGEGGGFRGGNGGFRGGNGGFRGGNGGGGRRGGR